MNFFLTYLSFDFFDLCCLGADDEVPVTSCAFNASMDMKDKQEDDGFFHICLILRVAFYFKPRSKLKKRFYWRNISESDSCPHHKYLHKI